MPCLLVCSASQKTADKVRNICQGIGWDSIITHLDVQTAQLLVDHKAEAALLDLEQESGDVANFATFLAESFPFFPLILLHQAPVTEEETPSGHQVHLRPNRLDELEHILISLTIMTQTAGDSSGEPALALRSVPRILVVDDDTSLTHVLARALRTRERFDVQTAHSGFQAGTMLPLFVPDVAIVDISLGDMDGRDVCAFIRKHERLAHTRIIGISGCVDADHLGQGARLFDEFMEKPFRTQKLVRMVDELLLAPQVH